jgi:hypothetical protein
VQILKDLRAQIRQALFVARVGGVCRRTRVLRVAARRERGAIPIMLYKYTIKVKRS